MADKKHLIFPAVAGGLLIAVGIVGGVTMVSQSAELAKQETAISEARESLAMTQGEIETVEELASVGMLGADPERMRGDREPIEGLLETALTWDSDESYTFARDEVMRKYSLAEDSAFMKSFLPEAPANYDSKGNRYPYIDAAGLNSRLSDFRMRLLSVTGTNYEYMVLANVQGVSSDGQGVAGNIATIFVTVDADGNMSNVSGFASTTTPLTSG